MRKKETAEYGWCYAETKSPITVQRQFQQKYERDPPSKSCIMKWVKNFQESSNVMNLPRSGRPSVSEEIVDNVQTAFQRSFSIS